MNKPKMKGNKQETYEINLKVEVSAVDFDSALGIASDICCALNETYNTDTAEAEVNEV
jgi:hypothetical protein